MRGRRGYDRNWVAFGGRSVEQLALIAFEGGDVFVVPRVPVEADLLNFVSWLNWMV